MRPLLPLSRLALTGLVLVAFGAACTSSDQATSEPPADDQPESTPTEPSTEVSVALFTFDPEVVEVDAGATVEWSNTDETQHLLVSTDDSDAIDVDLDGAGTTGSASFAEPGTYAYRCAIHPFMEGEVVVGGG